MSGRKIMTGEDCAPVPAFGLAGSCGPVRHADPETFDLLVGGFDLPDGPGDDSYRWPDARTRRRVPSIARAGNRLDVHWSKTDFIVLPKPFCMKDLIQTIAEARTLAASFPDLR